MRLLLDENLPVSLAGLLVRIAGWDVAHVRDLGMASSRDPDVPARAARDERVLVSADTDFATLLAASGASGPSIVLLRIGAGRRPERLAGLLVANLPPLAGDLAGGAMVVTTDQRVRVRRLPIG